MPSSQLAIPRPETYLDEDLNNILDAGRAPTFGEKALDYGRTALHGLGYVVGAPKRAEDALVRASARHLYGIDVPDDATTGSLVRTGLDLDPRENPESDTNLGRVKGFAAEEAVNFITDPLTPLLLGAGPAVRGGQLADRALARAAAGGFEVAPGIAETLAQTARTGAQVAPYEKAAQLAFAPQMAVGTLESARHAYETAKEKGASPELTEALLSTMVSGIMAGGVAHGLAKGHSIDPFAEHNQVEARPEAERVAPERPVAEPTVDLAAERDFLTPDRLADYNAMRAREQRLEQQPLAEAIRSMTDYETPGPRLGPKPPPLAGEGADMVGLSPAAAEAAGVQPVALERPGLRPAPPVAEPAATLLEPAKAPEEAPKVTAGAPEFEDWAKEKGFELLPEDRPAAVRAWVSEHPDATVDQRAAAKMGEEATSVTEAPVAQRSEPALQPQPAPVPELIPQAMPEPITTGAVPETPRVLQEQPTTVPVPEEVRPAVKPASPGQVDEAGVRVLPGEEHLPTAERALVDRRVEDAVKDLTERERAVREEVAHSPDAELSRVGVEDLISERRDVNDTRVEDRLRDLHGNDPVRRAARIREESRRGNPLADVPASGKEITAAIKRDEGNPLEMMAREAVRRNDPAIAEAAERATAPAAPFDVPETRSAPERRQSAEPVAVDRRAEVRRQVAREHPKLPAEAHEVIATERMARQDAEAAKLTAQRIHPLTGLRTLAAYRERFPEVARGEREVPEGHSVTFLDLANFKEMNDTIGHDAADKVLQRVGDILIEEAGAENAHHRSGDEFFAVHKTAETKAFRARLKKRLASEHVTMEHEDGRTVTIANGIGFHVGTGDSLAKADVAANASRGRTGREARAPLQPRGKAPAGGRVPNRARGAEAELAGTRFATTDKPTSGPTVDLARVRQAFKGAEWKQTKGGLFTSRIGDEVIVVEPDASITVTPIERQAMRRSALAQGGRPEDATVTGVTYRMPGSVIVKIAKGASDSTVDHEALHVAMRLALSEGERKAVLRKYGWDGKAETALDAEERAAYAYEKWTPDVPNGAFARVMSFFRKVYRSFFPDAESVFAKVRGGEAFGRKGAAAAEGTAFATRPGAGQRGLPGIAEDVPTKTSAAKPEQQDLFGAADMLKPTEARTTEGREAAGPLFTQDADARAKAEREAQGTMFATAPLPVDEPAPAPKINKATEAVRDDSGEPITGKPSKFPVNLDRIGVDEDVKQALARMVKAMPERMEKAKGYESQADTHRLALESGLTPQQLIKLQKEHGALTARHIEAGRILREEAAKDVTAKWEATKTATDKMQAELDFAAAVTRAGAITAETVAAGAEAGRALAAHRMMSEGLRPGERFFQKILRAHPALDAKVRDELLGAIASGDQRKIIAATQKATQPSRVSKFLEAWKAGLVSGPPTLVGNALSNTVFEGWRTAERGVSGVVDSMVSKIRGTEQERFASESLAAVNSLRTSFPQSLKLLANGLMEEQIKIGTKYEGQPGAIGGRTGEIVRLPFRVLQAFDDSAKHVAAQNELFAVAWRMAMRESKKGQIKDVSGRATEIINKAGRYVEARLQRDAGLELDKAAQEALADRESSLLYAQMDKAAHEATFQDAVGKFTQVALDARQSANFLGIPLGDIVAPFMKTPSRILVQAAKRTPLGFIDAARAWKGIKEGTHTQGEFSEALAKPLMGTMLAVGFYAAARQGLITGSGPSDDTKRKLLEATGWQPYSIRVGDSYLQFKRLEPLATILGLAADMAEAKDEKQAGTIAEKLQGALIQNITEKSWLTGITNVAQAWQDPKRYGAQWVRSLEGSLVPNVVRKAAQAIDPTVRDTRSALGPIAAGIPGASMLLPARTAGTGEEVERPATAAERFLSPFPRSTEKEGAGLERELLALDYSPAPPSKTLHIPGSNARIELTDRELKLFNDADKATTERLRSAVTSAGWKSLNGEERRTYVEKAYSDGRKSARLRLYAVPSVKTRAREALAQARIEATA